MPNETEREQCADLLEAGRVGLETIQWAIRLLRAPVPDEMGRKRTALLDRALAAEAALRNAPDVESARREERAKWAKECDRIAFILDGRYADGLSQTAKVIAACLYINNDATETDIRGILENAKRMSAPQPPAAQPPVCPSCGEESKEAVGPLNYCGTPGCENEKPVAQPEFAPVGSRWVNSRTNQRVTVTEYQPERCLCTKRMKRCRDESAPDTLWDLDIDPRQGWGRHPDAVATLNATSEGGKRPESAPPTISEVSTAGDLIVPPKGPPYSGPGVQGLVPGVTVDMLYGTAPETPAPDPAVHAECGHACPGCKRPYSDFPPPIGFHQCAGTVSGISYLDPAISTVARELDADARRNADMERIARQVVRLSFEAMAESVRRNDKMDYALVGSASWILIQAALDAVKDPNGN